MAESPTFVVQEIDTGHWVVGCCNDTHPSFEDIGTYDTKGAAERAANVHRRYDREEKARINEADACPTCGKPR